MAASGSAASGFGTSAVVAPSGSVTAETGATAIRTQIATDAVSQSNETGRPRPAGKAPVGNTSARAVRPAKAMAQPAPLAHTVNASRGAVVPPVIAVGDPMTRMFPRRSPTPISISSQAIGWRGLRAARTSPVPAYAANSTRLAGSASSRPAASSPSETMPAVQTARREAVPCRREAVTAGGSFVLPRGPRVARSCRGRHRRAGWTTSTGRSPGPRSYRDSSAPRAGTGAGASPRCRR